MILIYTIVGDSCMKEELLKRRDELHSEYRILLDRLGQIEQEKNKSIIEEQERLKHKSKIYKTFKRSKYLIELEKLKTELQFNKVYFHEFEEVKQVKARMIEISRSISKINFELDQIPHKRM